MNREQWLAVSAATAVALALAFGLYASTGRDDSHITYWAAHAIAEHGEYVNYGGHRVEMSSSLLQVLILAVLGRLTGMAIPNLAGLFAIPLIVLAIFLTSRLSALVGRRTSLFAVAILATSAYWNYWSLGGLDTPYAACLAVWLCLCVHRFVVLPVVRPGTWVATVVALLGVCLVRPEGSFVLLCALAGSLGVVWLRPGMVEGGPRARQRLLTIAFLSVGVIATIALVRWVYFGQVLPQPVYAKIGAVIYEDKGSNVVRSGWTYFSAISLWVIPFFLAAVSGMVWLLGEALLRRRQLPAGALLASMYVLAVIGFIYTSRGDWMEGGRFFVPVIPLLALFTGHVVDRLRKGAWLLLAVLLAFQLVSNIQFARRESTGLPFPDAIHAYRATGEHPDGAGMSWFERTNRVHIRDVATVEPLRRWVRQIAAQRPGPVTILSRQMGMVLYHVATSEFGTIDVLDRRGLADERLFDCAASSWLRQFPVGLDLEYQYLFDHFEEYKACGIRRPDIVFDFGDPRSLLSHGYRVVYYQDGAFYAASGWLPRRNVIGAQQWIAVRGDLVPAENRPETREIEFLMGYGD